MLSASYQQSLYFLVVKGALRLWMTTDQKVNEKMSALSRKANKKAFNLINQTEGQYFYCVLNNLNYSLKAMVFILSLLLGSGNRGHALTRLP